MRRFAIGLTVGAAMMLLSGVRAVGQSSDKDSGLNLALHAHSHANAETVGLPPYPGAVLYAPPDNGKKDNDSSLDMGLTFGDFHFTVIVVGYETGDPPERVLEFYRKPLSRYGDVLECDHGKPVGKLTMTSTGLTCSSDHGGHVQVNGSGDSSSDHELRAGSPHTYRIVGIDGAEAGRTHFGLVYLDLPKDNNKEE